MSGHLLGKTDPFFLNNKIKLFPFLFEFKLKLLFQVLYSVNQFINLAVHEPLLLLGCHLWLPIATYEYFGRRSIYIP